MHPSLASCEFFIKKIHTLSCFIGLLECLRYTLTVSSTIQIFYAMIHFISFCQFCVYKYFVEYKFTYPSWLSSFTKKNTVLYLEVSNFKALLFEFNKINIFTIVNVFLFLIRCGNKRNQPLNQIIYEKKKCRDKRY